MNNLLFTNDRVKKIGGSFEHTGTIVSIFTTSFGDYRVVVEFDPPVKGMLHIYRMDQVIKIKKDTSL